MLGSGSQFPGRTLQTGPAYAGAETTFENVGYHEEKTDLLTSKPLREISNLAETSLNISV